jgi:chromosome partitioning protein
LRTIAVIALKGGSGKTTMATHMALAAHMRGFSTFVADIDPQRSASEVLQAREGDGPRWVSTSGSELFATQMSAASSGVDAMVIDTAAGAVEDLMHAIVLADLSLLVVRPTLLDLSAAARTVSVVRRVKKASLIVVNQAPVARDGVEPPVVKRALRALEYMRLMVAPSIIRTRSVYQTALEVGRSAEEAADANAAREIEELWAFVERLVFGQRERVAAAAGE